LLEVEAKMVLGTVVVVLAVFSFRRSHYCQETTLLASALVVMVLAGKTQHLLV
jgi:hypothetical protein